MKNLFCPECEKEIQVHVDLTGGCPGHSDDPDDRCYCDDPDIRVRIEHPFHQKEMRTRANPFCYMRVLDFNGCAFAQTLMVQSNIGLYGYNPSYESISLVTDRKDLERMLFSGETLQDRLNKKYSKFLENTCNT